eukprot:gnl/MRDRNA2_/MRDRNA2_96441_c0_seq1.p1 gnl/MRDRNA2_/MRDRNA2_96441_c0~~gnl/MRDRNA2_/MRDRNA2_96441_c0_seq1.p1  ORF type:complete len:299 (+),score=35.37 gnl/MRDRNA2_/MRDRNA2_96441_c0_seq1:100-996(+)
MHFPAFAGTCLAFFAGGCWLATYQWVPAPKPSQHHVQSLHLWSDAELNDALMAIQQEQHTRSAGALPMTKGAGFFADKSPPTANFRNVHKHTYASSDPKAAAYFMEKYFGGRCTHQPGDGLQHTHCNDSKTQPMTWNVYYNATQEQPRGFSIHFVKNPRKLPHVPMNESGLALWLERWRGNFSATGRFDQFMDNHLGLLFDTLDPLVDQWERDGIPFICRTWCCGPGMPQYPDQCPRDRDRPTFPSEHGAFCEQGCYVEVPHGIIVEALCGLESYNASRKCLSRADSHLKVFDLCTDS